ncbi:MAG: SxtJ family membrane protein [Sporomusaceae bacterium]|nr:SxtJ family membrane protein [Sporomusaceae bacterium]
MKNDMQNIQTGQAFLLIFLLIILIFKQVWLFPWVTGFLVVIMVVPKIMSPFAKIWFLVSEKLGTVMSKIILSIIFYVVVCPIAIFRKMSGADAMQLKKWKDNTESVFSIREKTFTLSDLEKPY